MLLPNTTQSYNGLTIKKSPDTLSWRLCYANGKVELLIRTTGITVTTKTLECYTTKQECLNRIEELGLEYTPEPDPGSMTP